MLLFGDKWAFEEKEHFYVTGGKMGLKWFAIKRKEGREGGREGGRKG